MIDEEVVQFFNGGLTRAQLVTFQRETTKVITVLEVLPVALAARQWASRMKHRRVFFFIDNDAARAGLIKMTSDIPAIRRIQLGLVETWAANPSFPWYSRVPSSSNLADSVSRFEKMPILQNKSERVSPT